MARKTIIITEGQLSRIISESSGQYNIKSVYHVSSDDFNSFKTDIHFPYIFFSNKPITLNNSKYLYICNLSIHKPFIFEHAFSWSYPLWLYLTDKNGNLIERDDFTRDRFEGYLGCPFEFWRCIYEDDYEWETDQIPELVNSLNLGYDGVIIKDIQEGDTGLHVDDYIVFDPSQVEIVSKQQIS